jgi:hypothetical protein
MISFEDKPAQISEAEYRIEFDSNIPYLLKEYDGKTFVAKFDIHRGLFYPAIELMSYHKMYFRPAPLQPQFHKELVQGRYYYNPENTVHAQLIFIGAKEIYYFYNHRTNTLSKIDANDYALNKITESVENPISLVSWEPELNYRSASMIEYYKPPATPDRHDHELIMIGDDQQKGLVLDTFFKPLRMFDLVENPMPAVNRIPKIEKHDIEAGAIFKNDLFVFSSGTRPYGNQSNPNQCRVYDLLKYATPQLLNLDREFDEMIGKMKAVLGEKVHLNIEAAAFVGYKLVLANREDNTLFVFQAPPWPGKVPKLEDVIRVKLGGIYSSAAKPSISALCYLDKTDTLVFTCSTELRNHPDLDGEYGDSLLGYINGFSKGKIGLREINPTALYNITEFIPQAKGHKIEGCTGHFWGNKKGEDHLFLCSDNDGETSSAVFRVVFINKNHAPSKDLITKINTRK